MCSRRGCGSGVGWGGERLRQEMSHYCAVMQRTVHSRFVEFFSVKTFPAALPPSVSVSAQPNPWFWGSVRPGLSGCVRLWSFPFANLPVLLWVGRPLWVECGVWWWMEFVAVGRALRMEKKGEVCVCMPRLSASSNRIIPYHSSGIAAATRWEGHEDG